METMAKSITLQDTKWCAPLKVFQMERIYLNNHASDQQSACTSRPTEVPT